MKAGRLNCRVLIQRPGGSQLEGGQPDPDDWVNLITAGDGKVWANIRHLSGLETIKGDAEQAIGKASISIRYRTDVTEAMRVVHGSTTYQIKAVLPDETRREYVDLACEVVG